jgi:signal transduction histidine kinase
MPTQDREASEYARAAEQGDGNLSAFIRENHERIVREWESAVRQLPAASALARPALLDHIPDLVMRLAYSMDEAAAGHGSASLDSIPDDHALTRLDEGFDLDEVVREYGILRSTIERLWEEAAPGRRTRQEVTVLDSAIDEAVTKAVQRYTRTRDRTLHALNAISAAALETADVEAFLPRLLHVLLQTTEAVDSVAILLREGDVLRLRATVGLERESAETFTLRVGEGFAGTIAATKEPMELTGAATSPLVKSGVIQASGIRALYGIPLLRGNDVLGVAHVGSRSTFRFSDEDKLLFRVAAERFTAILVQAQLMKDEQEARAQAESALAALRDAATFRDQFIGILGHDLRNPVTAILGSAQLLQRHGALDGVQARSVARIGSSAERIARMVNDVLDFARGRLGGAFPLQRRMVNLQEVCQAAVDELRVAHPQRKIELVTAGSARGCWDSDRLAQVVSNLVGNAISYGREDAPVRVRLDDAGADVELSVTNAGNPIPPEMMPSLFEPYTRGSTAGRSKSLGLGLYIVSQIIRAHGGTVAAHSTERDGTTFTVRLPRAAGS